MDQQPKPRNDHWSSEAYTNAAAFVPKLTTKIIKYLDVQPDDNILDIGCGDGQLTAQIAASLTGTGRIHGLDASHSFINQATSAHQPPNCTYSLHDCTALASHPAAAATNQWDKVFSNAALHWILRAPATRLAVLRDVRAALRPGGRFVFEMGAKGNVAEVHAAFTAALLAHGLSLAAARDASPWFFPSADWMAAALEDVGFGVEVCETEYRPSKMTPATGAGDGGLVGWVRLMGAPFLDAVDEAKRESVVRYVCDVLHSVVTREEDGSQWLGYNRLRVVARKV